MRKLYAAFYDLSDAGRANVLVALCKTVLAELESSLEASPKIQSKKDNRQLKSVELLATLQAALRAAKDQEADDDLEERCLSTQDYLSDDDSGLTEEACLGGVAILNVFQICALDAELKESIVLEQALQSIPIRIREQAFKEALLHAS